MSYFKCMNGRYITCIGKGYSGTSISEEEYNTLLNLIQNRPTKAGYGYRLKEDLAWEEYEITPAEGADEEVTAEEIAAILLGET